MFMVITKYVKDIEEVDRWLPAHSAFLDRYYARKKVIFSGRRNPRTGGAILFRVDERAELDDPFRINGVTECEVCEIIPTKYDEAFAIFAERT